MKTNKKAMLAEIDNLQKAIELFILHGDDYISNMPESEWHTGDGSAIRDMQRRLARIGTDLQTLYRRLDT